MCRCNSVRSYPSASFHRNRFNLDSKACCIPCSCNGVRRLGSNTMPFFSSSETRCWLIGVTSQNQQRIPLAVHRAYARLRSSQLPWIELVLPLRDSAWEPSEVG